MSNKDPAFQLTDHRLAGLSCRDWQECCCTPCLARKEIVRLRAVVARLASSEAFDVSRMIDKRRDKELLMRMEYASAALQEADEHG